MNGFTVARDKIVEDWSAKKYVCWGLLVFVVSSIVTGLYYVNAPFVEPGADTPSYMDALRQIQLYAYPVHPVRLPVYPLFVVLIYAVTGHGHLMAVSLVQGILFVLTAVEVYALAVLVTKRAWLACMIAVLVGTNVILLGYSKQIMTEGLSLWLLTTLMLLTVRFMQTSSLRLFWWQLLFVILLCFTRPEWIALPVILYGYLWTVAVARKRGREFLPRVLVSMGVVYGLLGAYIGINAIVNGYPGLSTVQNMNFLGKVLQYDMYHYAPEDAVSQDIKRRLVRFIEVEKQGRSPYQFIGKAAPELGKDHAKLVGDFGRTIILQHPVEFVGKSIPLFFSSLTAYVPMYRAPGLPTDAGPFESGVEGLLTMHRVLKNVDALFPYAALAWLALLWRQRGKVGLSLEMGIIVLIAAYAVVITTLGGYYDQDYARVHTVFEPLIVLTVWGAVGMGIVWLVRYAKRREN